MKEFDIWSICRFSVGRSRNAQRVRRDKKLRAWPIWGDFLIGIRPVRTGRALHVLVHAQLLGKHQLPVWGLLEPAGRIHELNLLQLEFSLELNILCLGGPHKLRSLASPRMPHQGVTLVPSKDDSNNCSFGVASLPLRPGALRPPRRRTINPTRRTNCWDWHNWPFDIYIYVYCAVVLVSDFHVFPEHNCYFASSNLSQQQ